MTGKVLISITVLAVFVLVSGFTLKAKREEIQYVVEKKDFSFNDFQHDTSIVGGWNGRDYVVKIKINSPEFKLNMKLVLKDNKDFGNVNITSGSEGKRGHGKPYNFKTCAANGTRPMNNGTCKPRPLGFMKRTFITCQTTTVTVANWARNGATWTWKVILNGAMMMADKLYSGVTSITNWTWDRMIWLAKKTMDGVIWGAEWALDIMTWLVEKAWDGVIWIIQWTWDGVTWLAEKIWYGVSLVASQIWDGVADLYTGYLESHVTYVKACVTGLTWEDENCLLIAVVAVCVSLLFITRAVKVIRRRRLERQAQLAKEKAERLAAAAKKRKRASILNQKNRHKKKLL